MQRSCRGVRTTLTFNNKGCCCSFVTTRQFVFVPQYAIAANFVTIAANQACCQEQEKRSVRRLIDLAESHQDVRKWEWDVWRYVRSSLLSWVSHAPGRREDPTRTSHARASYQPHIAASPSPYMSPSIQPAATFTAFLFLAISLHPLWQVVL